MSPAAPLGLTGHEDYTKIAQLVQPPQIPPHRSHDPANNQKRSDPFQFGSRYLEEGDDVFEFNAWDHVETDDDYKQYAELQFEKQRENPVSDFDRARFNADPAKWWNMFYKNNVANFFKNRKWLQMEFPVLAEVSRPDAGPKTVLEVGAGAGNSAFPILAKNENPWLRVHACDYSKKAVEVMRNNENYDINHMAADVWDVTAEGEGSLPPGLTEESVDVVVMIFVFSALAPSEWSQAVTNVYRVLKPGGQVLFRDYGRGDLAQVRFKKGRWMRDNFYIRGDGTRVYFFPHEELQMIWGGFDVKTGIPDMKQPSKPSSDKRNGDDDGKGFHIHALGVDNRLLVNRQKKLKMYRCWIQGRFEKKALQLPSPATATLDKSNAPEDKAND